MRLHLIRHFAPTVAPGLCYGRTDLDVDTQLQANLLPALHARLPLDAPVFSSPLRRCAALAASLASDPVRYDARLVELDFGSWEMQPWGAIPRAEIDDWAANVTHYRPGGGESVADMARRVCAFYDEMLASGLACAIVVCHAGAMRLLAARARGLSPEATAHEAASRPHAIGYGEIMVLDCV